MYDAYSNAKQSAAGRLSCYILYGCAADSATANRNCQFSQHGARKCSKDALSPFEAAPLLLLASRAASRAARDAARQLQSAVSLTTPTVPKQKPNRPPQNSPAAPANTTSAAMTAKLHRSILRNIGCKWGKAAAKMLSCGMSLSVKDASGLADFMPADTPALKPLIPLWVPAATPPSTIQ